MNPPWVELPWDSIEENDRSKRAGPGCIVTSQQQPSSASSMTGVGRWCNGYADSERITTKSDELDNYNSQKCWESSDLLTRTESYKRAELFIETENLCYNKKDIDGNQWLLIDKESNLILKKIISKVFKISDFRISRSNS